MFGRAFVPGPCGHLTTPFAALVRAEGAGRGVRGINWGSSIGFAGVFVSSDLISNSMLRSLHLEIAAYPSSGRANQKYPNADGSRTAGHVLWLSLVVSSVVLHRRVARV